MRAGADAVRDTVRRRLRGSPMSLRDAAGGRSVGRRSDGEKSEVKA